MTKEQCSPQAFADMAFVLFEDQFPCLANTEEGPVNDAGTIDEHLYQTLIQRRSDTWSNKAEWNE